MSFDLQFGPDEKPWIWLDLDDTLWDFKTNSEETLVEFYAAHGLERLWPTAEKWIEAYHAVNHELWERYGRGEIGEAYLRTERFRRPLTEAGMDEEEAERVSAEFDGDYLERLARRSRLLPGALELLESLKAGGFHLGILSNGFADIQRKKLKSSGIEGYFEHLVLSEEAEAPKPSPEIFRYAERLCGAKASECVMIGDNPLTDIAGARAAGWTAYPISDFLN